MNDTDLWNAWTLWVAVGAVVVLIAAGLLIAILVTARRILGDAARALAAADAIRRQTGAIWQLEHTNDAAAEIRNRVRAIEQKSTALAEALHRHAPAGTSRTS